MASAKLQKSEPLIGKTDMAVIERFFDMGTGYVLDFSNRTFDEFIGDRMGIDASAPRFSKNGTSKANRLRTILHSLPAKRQAELLRALAMYRDSAAKKGQFEVLDDEWRDELQRILEYLENDNEEEQDGANSFAASAWTGRRTVGEQITVVRSLAPIAIGELDTLASLVEARRFNDPITADAVTCLRELHHQLGELLSAIERGSMSRQAVEAIEANRERLSTLLKEGAKLTIVAPSMTYGVMHILSWLTGVPIDSTLVSAVFGTIVGADALNAFSKRSTVSNK